jgi:hypothetical protein
MADRPLRAIVLVFAAALTLPACGGGARPNAGDADRPSAVDSRRQQFADAAAAALKRYDPRPTAAGLYAGRTSGGGRAVVRVSPRRRVRFSIVASCRHHPLRAFPNRPPRLRRGGAFSYRERGRAYRLSVSGRVRGRSVRGTIALAGRPRRGPPCRARAGWRARRR